MKSDQLHIKTEINAKTEIINTNINIEYADCKNRYFLANTAPRKYKSFDRDPYNKSLSSISNLINYDFKVQHDT